MAIFQKASDYHFFFILIPHISRLFLSYSFFRKTIQSRSTRNTCRNLQKNISGDYKRFFVLWFSLSIQCLHFEKSLTNFFFFFIPIQLYSLWQTKWVSIFENFNFLYWLILFILFFSKILGYFFVLKVWRNENVVKLDFIWNRSQFH